MSKPVGDGGSNVREIIEKIFDQQKLGKTSISKQKLTVYSGKGEWKEGTLLRNIKATLGIRGYRSIKDIVKMSVQRGVVNKEFINLLAESKSNRWYSSINPMTVGKKTLDVLQLSNKIIQAEKDKGGDSIQFKDYAEDLGAMKPAQRADVIRLVAQNLPDLKTVRFYDCGDIVTDDMVGALAKHCPNLTAIDLSGCGKHITNEAVKALAERRPKLTIIMLSGCEKVSDGILLTLLSKDCWKELTHVNLSGTGVTDNAAQWLSSREKLKEVSFAGCIGISSVTLEHFAAGKARLDKLVLDNCLMVAIERKDVENMKNPPAKHISVVGCQYLSQEAIEALKAKKGVEQVSQ